MLVEAAEIEHAICCQYLFAAFGLKQSTNEGVTDRQLRAIERWRATILEIAAQEMLHFVLVNNLLAAIGAASSGTSRRRRRKRRSSGRSSSP